MGRRNCGGSRKRASGHSPAETEVNVPGGAVASPVAFRPQHSTVPSVWIPQLWNSPAETSMNVPGGESDWPW